MLRFLLIVAVGAIVLLILGGVVEVQIHTENIARVPGAVGKALSGTSLLSQARVQVVRVKRKGELFIAGDDDKKMAVMLKYVEKDSQRLADAIEQGEHPNNIVPQAQLLADSVEQLKEQSQRASADALVEYKERSEEVFIRVKSALEKLQEVQKEYESYQERLEGVSEDLQESLGDGGENGSVESGSSAEDTSNDTESTPEDGDGSAERAPIPLKF